MIDRAEPETHWKRALARENGRRNVWPRRGSPQWAGDDGFGKIVGLESNPTRLKAPREGILSIGMALIGEFA